MSERSFCIFRRIHVRLTWASQVAYECFFFPELVTKTDRWIRTLVTNGDCDTQSRPGARICHLQLKPAHQWPGPSLGLVQVVPTLPALGRTSGTVTVAGPPRARGPCLVRVAAPQASLRKREGGSCESPARAGPVWSRGGWLIFKTMIQLKFEIYNNTTPHNKLRWKYKGKVNNTKTLTNSVNE